MKLPTRYSNIVFACKQNRGNIINEDVIYQGPDVWEVDIMMGREVSLLQFCFFIKFLRQISPPFVFSTFMMYYGKKKIMQI